jgi:hypothetical protein
LTKDTSVATLHGVKLSLTTTTATTRNGGVDRVCA